MFYYNNTNNNKRTFKRVKCHPRTTQKKKSCVDYKLLLKLKKIWNLRHPDNKIKHKNKKDLFNSLRESYSNVCDNEICWIDKAFNNNNELKNKIKKKTFAPVTPKIWNTNINEWLNSTDIVNVMSQYEDKYKKFKFLGPAPIDFDSITHENSCVWPEICNINIRKFLDDKIYYIGFIFNTDKHYQSGSHWFAMYLNLKDKYLFTFDSTGKPHPPEITKLIQKIYRQCLNNNINIKLLNNVGIKHQYGNTECGMYSLYFIITLLEKINNYNVFKKNIITDNLVQKFRTIYFNKI